MYFVSKTLAEKEAWKFAKEHGMDFITIIPPLVVGPFLMPTMPPSLITALSPITGKLLLGNSIVKSLTYEKVLRHSSIRDKIKL